MKEVEVTLRVKDGLDECKNKLERINNTYKCVNNHSYDISRDGYVNLLINQTNLQKNTRTHCFSV